MTWKIILLDEVAQWVESLDPQDLKMVQRMLAMLSQEGQRMRMPHSRPLGQGLFELRFEIRRGTVAQRITYFFDPVSMIICLTTFHKTRQLDLTNVARARRAMNDYKRRSKEQ